MANHRDEVHVSYLLEKSRVAPLKPISIPRLELTAAVISVNVVSMLKSELDIEDIPCYYYTDSEIVIGCINNDARRFHVYVGNRVQHIRDRSSPGDWFHVPGKENPTEEASRGLTAKELLQSDRWFTGPKFLWQQDPLPQQSHPVYTLLLSDAEVRKDSASTFTTEINEVETRPVSPGILELQRFNHFSSFNRLKRCIVRIQRAIEKTRLEKKHNWRPQKGPPLVAELSKAENFILRSLQHHQFQSEIKILSKLDGNDDHFKDSQNARKRNNTVKPISNLYKLDPFLDEEGLLRVGGRLKNSTSPYKIKHHLIMPKTSHVTVLLIRQFHHGKQHHQGYGMTHNAIRQAGYYIINGRSMISHIIAKCVTCRKLRGRTQDQKMSDLPPERLTPSPPFTYTGMDVFGPFYIKEGRKELKRWGLIFTCLASRAIHLETLNTMTTDSFLNSLRRFISRRGKVRQLRSDQGSNFVGAKNELSNALKELDQTPVREYLTAQDCDWIEFSLNVPHASHMGGVWERQIRTTRSVLSSLLLDHGTQLDDEALRTLMTEAESIVNCRPLTVENLTDPLGSEPLTPNHLLTLKTQVVLAPPGKFESPDLYSRKRWRRVQYLANQFWLRWQKEYCTLLQKRQKWPTTKTSIMVGDVVLACDGESPRNQWLLAVVTKVLPSQDNLVRKVQIMTAKDGEKKFFQRPVHKLVLILPKEDNKN
ncbi:uncharacterized protein [Montipora capricornis]|uniref:uncharacterized protein n=1 Tax=Montipora capricornis TaxID=246305 RepID=UPI0035F1649E